MACSIQMAWKQFVLTINILQQHVALKIFNVTYSIKELKISIPLSYHLTYAKRKTNIPSNHCINQAILFSSATAYRLFNTIIYPLNMSFWTSRKPVDHPLVVLPVFAWLSSHGARSLPSTEEVAVAVALPLAVTTWALAVTTLAVVVDVLALKPVMLVVLFSMIFMLL